MHHHHRHAMTGKTFKLRFRTSCTRLIPVSTLARYAVNPEDFTTSAALHTAAMNSAAEHGIRWHERLATSPRHTRSFSKAPAPADGGFARFPPQGHGFTEQEISTVYAIGLFPKISLAITTGSNNRLSSLPPRVVGGGGGGATSSRPGPVMRIQMESHSATN